MWTARYWKDLAERVVATAAQAAVGAWGTTAVIGDVDWRIVAGTAAAAAALAVIKALAAAGKGDPTSASLVR